MSTSGTPSVSLQKATISSNLNSSLLMQYLVGMYTGVYFITIYLYIYRLRARASITLIAGSLTALFGIAIYECFAQWYNTTVVFASQGITRQDLFDLSFFGPNNVPKWIPVLSIIANSAGYIIADTLMIWRCLHITNRSLLVMALPLLLFSAEIALALAENVIYILLTFKPGYSANLEHAKLFDHLDASLGFITAATSLLATFIITHKIYWATRKYTKARKRYGQIVDIVVQSSVTYSLVILCVAICNIFLFATNNPLTSLTAGTIIRYLNVVAVIATGLSPTLMVARLTLASQENSDEKFTTDTHISSLQAGSPTLDSGGTSASEVMRMSDFIDVESYGRDI